MADTSTLRLWPVGRAQFVTLSNTVRFTASSWKKVTCCSTRPGGGTRFVRGIRLCSDTLVSGGVIGKDAMWTEGSYDINRFLSVGLQTGLTSPFFMQQLLRTPSPKLDEHTTLRVKRNRFVDMHYRVGSGETLGIYHKL